MYLRLASLLTIATAALMFSGCCCTPPMGGCFTNAPIGCETDCGPYGNASYDMGYGVPGGPLETIQMWRQNLICGDGCGGLYRGEWRSTPPGGACCGDEAFGPAYPCQPTCWFPGLLLSNLYGKRFCNGCGDACGYGGATISQSYPSNCGCSDDIYSDAEYMEQPDTTRIPSPATTTPRRPVTSPTTNRSNGTPSRSRITRAAGTRQMSSRQN